MTVEEAGQRLREEIRKAVVGQEQAVELALVALLADGHVLLEGVPGVAKTLLVRSLSLALSLETNRIQFTPDLMPSDLIGTNVFDPRTTDFRLRRGPVFTNVLLADEINRTPPKTQAALLEGMEERQATIDGERYSLPDPFIVFATQNPIEFEGTYPLPEAQLDRFLFKVVLDYPEPADELSVLRRHGDGFATRLLAQAGLTPVTDAAGIADLRRQVRTVRVEDGIYGYILDIVTATRKAPDLAVGASPRAGIALLTCSRAMAMLRGRNYVNPDDVKELSGPVLRHRVILRPEAEIEGLTADRVLRSLIDAQTVPR